jgi:hypothetical protein
LIDSQELLVDKLEALFASHGASVVLKADVQIDTLDLLFNPYACRKDISLAGTELLTPKRQGHLYEKFATFLCIPRDKFVS